MVASRGRGKGALAAMNPMCTLPDVVLALDIHRDVRDTARKGILVIGEAQPDRGTAPQPVVLASTCRAALP